MNANNEIIDNSLPAGISMKKKRKARTRRRCRADALKVLIIMLLIIGVTVGVELVIENLTVVQDLKINYETDPLGVGTSSPVKFSWSMSSGIRGQSQKNYEIRVYEGETGQGKPIWTSGVVKSDRTMNIKAEGLHLEKEKRYSWKVLVQPSWGWKIVSGAATFVTDTDFEDAEWIIPSQDGDNASLIRKEAEISRMTVQEAYLYITSLGNYRAYIEGQELSDIDEKRTVLAPGWTDYNKYVNYQTYDVTDVLSSNLFDNTVTIGIELSKGWYGSDYGENAGYNGAFGPDDSSEELGVIAKLVLRYANGKVQTVATGGRDWYSSSHSDVRFAGISNSVQNRREDRLTIDGAVAREIDRWIDDDYAMPVNFWNGVETAEYSGSLVSSSKSTARIADEYERMPVSAYTYSESENITGDSTGYTYGQVSRHEIDLKKNKKISLNPGEKLVLDYGTFASGQVDLSLSGIAGTDVTVIYAGRLNDGINASGTGDQNGSAFGSIGGTGSVSYTYMLSGDDKEHFLPRETYEGYRYVGITANQPVTILSAGGKVYTSVGSPIGNITTSSREVNAVIDDIKWNQISGTVSVPNRDVPEDEREGDLSYAQVCCVTDLFNADAFGSFMNLNEIMQDCSASTQGFYGLTGPVSDAETFGNSAGISDAGILIPWQLYQQTGDIGILEDHYNQMVMYMNRIFTESYSMPLTGDPMAIEGTSGNCMGEIYRLYCTLIMQLVSDFTGRTEIAAVYEERFVQFKEEFMNKYLDEEGNLLSASADGVTAYDDGTPVIDNSQTALFWALKLSLYRTDHQQMNMMANLVSSVRNPGGMLHEGYPENTLMTGLFGTNIALPVLSDNGYSGIAYNVLLQKDYPSWIYTAMTEGFGNHIDGRATDSVGEWLYRYMAGITQDAYEPGFKRIILQPTADNTGTVTDMTAEYNSPAGKIKSSWETSYGKLRVYSCEIPANTTAKLYLQISHTQASSLKRPKGMEYTGMETHNGQLCASYELKSGSYKIKIPVENKEKK